MFTWLRRLPSVVLFLILASLAHAEPNWIVTPTPTNQDLWGVTWANGQFVTVGQAGTVLTSPDGITWTSRTSGTNAWLLAVAYAPHLQRWVAVGAGGTILTSPDAATWSPVASGTTERLNGIAVGGGRIVAVGENSTVVSSTNASTWTVAKVGTPGWLRGIAYVDGAFVFGGKAAEGSGPMPLYQSVDGVSFVEITNLPVGHGMYPLGASTEAIHSDGSEVAVLSWVIGVGPAQEPLAFELRYNPHPDFLTIWTHARGVVLFDDWWFAAGTGGTIFGAPRYGDARTLADRYRFGDTTFTAMAANGDTALAVGSGGVIVRTTREARTPSIVWNMADSSRFSAATSGSTVTFRVSADGTEPTLQWYHNGRAIPGATRRTLEITQVQPSDTGDYHAEVTTPLGKMAVSPRHVQVITPLDQNYAIDPSFRTTRKVGLPLAVTAEGKLLVPAQKTSGAGLEIIRLQERGAVDPAFAAIDFDSTFGRMRVAPDGRIVTAMESVRRYLDNGVPDPGFDIIQARVADVQILSDGRLLTFTVQDNRLKVARYAADGTVDATYIPIDQVLFDGPPTLFNPRYTRVTVAPDNSTWIVAASSIQGGGTGHYGVSVSQIFRLSADGNLLVGPVQLDATIYELRSTSRGIYYIRASRSGRLTSTFADDPAYSPVATTPYEPNPTLGPDGSVAASKYGILELYNADGKRLTGTGGRLGYGYQYAWLEGALFGASSTFGYPDGLVRIRTPDEERATRIANVSARQATGLNDGTLTLGFSISGAAPKQILARGLGPALVPFGISPALPDPEITLWDKIPMLRAQNDDWDTFQADEINARIAALGALPLPRNSRDAGMLAKLESGTYTVQVTGGIGIALAEAYDLDPPADDEADPRIANCSVRAFAGQGGETLILGFTVLGPAPKLLLIRAAGPTLGQYGVNGVLNDPIMTVYRGQTAIAWANDERTSGIDKVPGPFPLTSEREPALLLTLSEGSYTVQASSADGGTGVALLEVYEVR